jgi:hypothetical protein
MNLCSVKKKDSIMGFLMEVLSIARILTEKEAALGQV